MKKFFGSAREQLTLERIKVQSFFLLTITLMFFGLFGYECVKHYMEGKIGIHAHPTFNKKKVGVPNYDEYNYSEESRTLWYKPQSLQEALIFYKLGSVNLLHTICYLAIGIVVFVTIRGVTNEQTFSVKLFNAFHFIAFVLLFLPVANSIFQIAIQDKYLRKITQDQFSFEAKSPSFNEVIGPLLILYLLYFIKRGIQLEEEQTLTV